MPLYFAVPLVLLTGVLATSGVAAMAWGWVLPWNRRYVRRPRLFGLGQLIAALALSWNWVVVPVIGGDGLRHWGSRTGSLILLVGLLVTWIGESVGGERGADSHS
ncbi:MULTISPECIES: hypothetical protein [unclassified Streptomyces]|uniref:hypothetical protein n=1 Tax=unclassified Streptomyces TaxID=2593676 RepID=UPI00382BA109